MKIYKYAVLFFLGCATHVLKAQEKPYNSMIFRSQIFDKSHLPVKNENLSVEVELFTKDKVWYSEKQQINTNNEGLAFIQVGKGTSITGKFNEVPFSNQEISLRVKYKVLNSNGTASGEYVQLQSTDLYAVPYAFHALTADSVTGNSKDTVSTSTDSTGDSNSTLASKGNTWSVYGNRYVGMRNGFLGTVDASPLNFKTNNQTRINITPDGKINFLGDINLGNTNTLTVTNLATQNITANNVAANNLVAQTGVIESTAQSTSPDTGALIVKGGTGIKKNLNVGENLSVSNNTNLSGNLQVAGTSKFADKADFDKAVKINDISESNNLNEGSFVTAGGASVAKNLNVGGNTNVSGNMNALQNLAVGQNIKANGTDNATNKDHGAVIIESGGLGVEKDIVAGGSIRANANIISDNNLTVANTTNLNTLNVAGNSTIQGITKIANNTFSTTPAEGALVVQGGVGIGENLNVAQNAKINGVLTTNNVAVNNALQINGTADAVDQNSGALIVTDGGLGVEKNIYSGKNITAVQDITANKNLTSLLNTNVGQNLTVAANTTTNSLNVNTISTLGGVTTITNGTSSTSPATGALIVGGGLGVNQNVNVGQNLNTAGNLNVAQNANVNGTLTANNLTLNNTLQINGTADAVDQNSGALIVTDGGLGVEKNIYSGKNITAVQNITANGNLNALQNANVGQSLAVAANTTTNTLAVNSTATIGGITNITNATISTSPSTGALVVGGGLGVNENINVGQNLNVTKDTNLNGNLYTNKLSTFNDLAAFNKQVEIKSTVDEDNNKALEVDGGAIIGKRLHIKSTLSQPYGDFTNAALKVDGGAIINGNLSVLGKIFAQNASVNTLTPFTVDTYTYYSNPFQQPLLNNQGYGPDNLIDSYAFKVNAVDQGIAIKLNKHAESNYGAAYGAVNSTDVTTGNNFISFWNRDGKMVGRIEGQNLSELIDKDGAYLRAGRFKALEERSLVLKIAFKAFEEALELLEKQKSDKSKETSAGLKPGGVTGGTSNGGSVVGGGSAQASQAQDSKSNLELLTATKYAEKVVSLAKDILISVETIDVFSDLREGLENTVGVVYSSSAGDYAEYLELTDHSDFQKIIPAQVVGVKGGKISLNTNGSDKIMVVSTNPAVVGKTPSKENEKKFKAVAFMGQVPVFVLNKAKIGDYIIPSGNNDGYAVAKSKDMMEIDDYKNIIGIAWEETNVSKLINVVVGINTNDVVGVIKEQQTKITDLESRLTKIENYLSKNPDATFTTKQVNNDQEIINDDSKLTSSKNLIKNDSFNKIVASIVQSLKEQNIDALKNKDLYIENEVNNYFAGIFFAKELNQKLNSDEQKFLNQCFKFVVNQVKANLL
jgi:hypothetical protein